MKRSPRALEWNTRALKMHIDEIMDLYVETQSKAKETYTMEFTTVQELIDYLSNNFNPETARGVDAVIQYHISGDEGGDWNITIKEGNCKIEEGIKDSPVVTYRMAGKTWLGLASKTLNPMLAFTTGRIRIKGDLAMAQKVPKFFGI